MILFYRKSTGDVFATIAGRVHDSKQTSITISDSTIPADDIGKVIIGWEETDELEKVEKVEEEYEEFEPFAMDDGGGEYFKKITKKRIVERPVYKKIEHNINKFNILKEIESVSATKGTDYNIGKTGQFTKKPIEKVKNNRTRVATDSGMTGEINLRREAIRTHMKDLRKNKPIKLDKNI